jgi:hypothetical protein
MFGGKTSIAKGRRFIQALDLFSMSDIGLIVVVLKKKRASVSPGALV